MLCLWLVLLFKWCCWCCSVGCCVVGLCCLTLLGAFCWLGLHCGALVWFVTWWFGVFSCLWSVMQVVQFWVCLWCIVVRLDLMLVVSFRLLDVLWLLLVL